MINNNSQVDGIEPGNIGAKVPNEKKLIEPGWFNTIDIPNNTTNTDFMEYSIYSQIILTATAAYSKITQQGYSSWTGAFTNAGNKLII